MPNKPSKQLQLFLEETGAIHGTPTEIALAKQTYRREYKKKWKQTAKKNKEIRPTFTKDEYAFISHVAEMHGMAPTTYLRELALKGNTDVIPHRDVLLLVLQKISMAYIQAKDEQKPYMELLRDAEQLLLRYVNQK